MERVLFRRLFLRAAVVVAGAPLVALPFWFAEMAVEAWAGSLAFFEVVAAPLALALAAVTFYRKVRRFHAGTYLAALAAASVLGVGTWYLGLGWHTRTLGSPDPLTVELMGIALGVQFAAAGGAVLVIAAVRRMRAAEEPTSDESPPATGPSGEKG